MLRTLTTIFLIFAMLAPVIVRRGYIICPDAIGTTGGRGHVRACLIVKGQQPPAPLHR